MQFADDTADSKTITVNCSALLTKEISTRIVKTHGRDFEFRIDNLWIRARLFERKPLKENLQNHDGKSTRKI